jgi:glycosyltransferase involved in cell wall biosynthesis
LKINFSIIIPVYNRPDEIDELLQSLSKQTYSEPFEVVIVEDGSKEKCDKIVAKYKQDLHIKYLSKPNTGAGLSRNFGMKNASGNYFIILDSDVLLPPTYLDTVSKRLADNYTDAFGGPDTAHKSFSDWQKAINYSMTSFLTTGGLRGGKNNTKKFQPRSFNMGLSKKAFKETGGFTERKIGEDIDLSFRLRQLGFESRLLSDAFVYHKRRTSIAQFFKQTYNFGKERPVLNRQYRGTAKLTYWFPSLFVIAFISTIILAFVGCLFPLFLLMIYLMAILIDSGLKNKSIKIGFISVLSTLIQFFGYGIGFLKAGIHKKRLTIM